MVKELEGGKKNGGLAAFLVKKFELNPPLPIYFEASQLTNSYVYFLECK